MFNFILYKKYSSYHNAIVYYYHPNLCGNTRFLKLYSHRLLRTTLLVMQYTT